MYLMLTQNSVGKINKGLYVIEKIHKDTFLNVTFYRFVKRKIYKQFFNTATLRKQYIVFIYDIDNDRVVYHDLNFDPEKLKEIALERFERVKRWSDDRTA